MADEQPPTRSQPPDQTADDLAFRWTHFFNRSTQPLFVLNRRRQILFVNTASETLTGHKARELHKRVCKRQRDAAPGSCEAVQHALSPPREVLAGELTQARRLFLSAEGNPCWWDILFVPLVGTHGLLGVVGKIQPVATRSAPLEQPLPEKLVALRHRQARQYCLANLDAGTPAMQRVAQQVNLASRLRIPVLLVGEEGTGKEWLARTIHREGDGRENTFVALDCRRLPAPALVRVLFGPGGWVQRRGVTLYFREPAYLARELQARLHELVTTTAEDDRPALRVLAGCSSDPAADVRAGRLLDEWHCWLSPLTIHVPPLCERLADLPALVQRLLRRATSAGERPVTGLTEEAWALVRGYSWPGNLRELYAVLAGACAPCQGEVLQVADLPWYLRPAAPVAERKLPLDQLLEQVERRLIQIALVMAKGNKSRAAEILEIWRPRLTRRIEALGIEEQ
jgi:transcriptional regulator with PAS, ATPase and Fis domain